MDLNEGLRDAPFSAGKAAADDALAWARFSQARLASEFCESWLALVCRLVPNTSMGLLLLEDGDNSFAPAATYPADARNVADLVPVGVRALRQRRGEVARTEGGGADVAYPIDIRGKLWGVVALRLGAGPEIALQSALRQLHWGAGWMEALFHRRQLEEDTQKLTAARLAVDMVAVIGPAKGLTAAATALANELAVRLDCRRVAIGGIRRGRIKVLALSHSAGLKRELKLLDSLANAMEEAADQAATVGYPAVKGAERRVGVAHQNHQRDMRIGSVLSVVMTQNNQPVGVITLERDLSSPWDLSTVSSAEAVASLAGPVIGLQRDLERIVTGSAVRLLARIRLAVLGRGHPTLKLACGLTLALALWLCLATADFRIAGKATIEGQVQHALMAPFDGFIETAPRRAGDIVQQNEVLATLDTRDYEIEALRYEAQREEARLKQQSADGKHDRAEASIQAAYAAEADAQFKLANSKIERAHITAPFRGIIVSGDLTQQIGSPAERGKTLFEIAPLDSYRVVVQADEREITYVRPGEAGRLVLNGLSSAPLDFDVVRVVPVAVPGEGRNSFRVEGILRTEDPRLRPGMEGVGKIVAGRDRLIWIWTHPIIDWARLTLWKWLP